MIMKKFLEYYVIFNFQQQNLVMQVFNIMQGELNKLLDKFVLWKKENIKFQSSLEPGPEVFQYTLKAWFTAEHNITIDSKIIDSNFKETILPDLKDNLIKYIDYNLRCSEKERN